MARVFLTGLLAVVCMGAAEAQTPTFGSPYALQRVEITDEATGDRRVITLEKRAGDGYDIEVLDMKSGRRSSGVLRADGGNRYSGDIFDHARGSFREVVVVEQEDGAFGIEQFDYVTRKRVRGTMRCDSGGCEYRPG